MAQAGQQADSFQHYVSIFEDFFFDLTRIWLTAYPGSLLKKQIDVDTVLKIRDPDAIVQMVIDRELNEWKYQRVAEWFNRLNGLVKLGCPSEDEIARLAEMKASRDIFAHNRGIVNAVYLQKAGSLARYRDGERMELPEPYLRESWQSVKKLIEEMSAAAIQKV